ncbi:MAG TPA: hypothetical protein VIQ01_08485 [Burkholderiales bacterium]
MLATGKLAFLLERDAIGSNACLVDLERARSEFKTVLHELTGAPDNSAGDGRHRSTQQNSRGDAALAFERERQTITQRQHR